MPVRQNVPDIKILRKKTKNKTDFGQREGKYRRFWNGDCTQNDFLPCGKRNIPVLHVV